VSGHVAYLTYLDRHKLVSHANWTGPIDGKLAGGFFFLPSTELLQRSEPQLFVEAKRPWCVADPKRPWKIEPVTVRYASVIDHEDQTVSFARVGRTPCLYYTRFSDGVLDRNVVRVPITFSQIDSAVRGRACASSRAVPRSPLFSLRDSRLGSKWIADTASIGLWALRHCWRDLSVAPAHARRKPSGRPRVHRPLLATASAETERQIVGSASIG